MRTWHLCCPHSVPDVSDSTSRASAKRVLTAALPGVSLRGLLSVCTRQLLMGPRAGGLVKGTGLRLTTGLFSDSVDVKDLSWGVGCLLGDRGV